MKEFECKFCNKIWFVKLDMADEVIGCPFCMRELPKPRVVVVDSFENAVLKVIVDYGVEIVSDRRKFLSYLTDVAFNYRKEIKILSNACDSKVFTQFYELSLCKLDDAKLRIQQIQQHLVDEEGIAEGWAKRICECFICAIREDFTVDVAKTSSTSVLTESKESKSKKIPPVTSEKQQTSTAQSNMTVNQFDVDAIIRNFKKLIE